MRKSKSQVLVITGPTASGKSALGVRLAKRLNGEIISADSRQVYKGLDIGTGKITKKEMGGIPHYLLDVADPKKQFNASQYKELGEVALKKIIGKNKLPIIVGGTGFYIDALTSNTSLPQVPANNIFRKELSKLDTSELYKILRKKDLARAKAIDKHNKVRLIRALEIVEVLGKVPKAKKERPPYQFIYIGLKPEKLEQRIKTRLHNRMNGMIREARRLHQKGLPYKRMEELGLEYKFLAKYLKGEMGKEEMGEKLNIAIRQYSKRQMTWFKKNKKIKWFKPEEYREIENYVQNMLR